MVNLFRRLFGKRRFGSSAERKFYTPYQRDWALARLNIPDKPLEQPYAQHAWVYACIRSIATRVASVPFVLYQGTSQDPRKIEDGDLYEIFNRPNPYWTRYHLWEATATYLMLQGNALWVMERTHPSQPPTGIYVFGKENFKPVFRKGTREIDHWDFRVQSTNQTIRLEPFQVAWFLIFNPYSEFWGMAPMEAARAGAEQDWLAQLMNRSFFENSCTPGGVLKINHPTTGDQIKQYRTQFESKYMGTRKSFRLLVLPHDIEYDPIRISYIDMQFVEQRKMSREEICAVFHVPPSEIGVFDRVHKAVAKGVQRQYWEGTIKPILRLVEDTLRAQFFLPYDGEKTWGAFDFSNIEALKDDEDAKIERAEKLFKMGVPLNTINEVLNLGLPKIEGGDVGYLPMTLFPVTDRPKVVPYTQPQEDGKALPLSVKPLIEPPVEQRTIKPDSAEHKEIMGPWIQKMSRPEKLFAGKIRTYLQKIRSFFLLILGKGQEEFGEDVLKYPESMFDLPKEFDDRLAKMASKHYENVALAMAPLIEADINGIGIAFTFDPKQPDIADFMKTKVIKVVENINGGLRERVRAAIVKAKEEGATFRELQESLVSLVEGDRKRALRIARTETAQASNGLEYQSFRIAGVKLHQWVAALDERTRDSHLEMMNLGPWPLGKQFPNGCMYPGDVNGPPEEVINCRCKAIPVE